MLKTFAERNALGHPNLILDTLSELAAEKGWKFGSSPKRLLDDWRSISCVLQTPEFETRFNLQQMPGCCAVLIAYYIDVHPWTQEAFDAVLRALEEATFAAGFGSLMMAQVTHPHKADKEPWALCLERGWEITNSFINAKSDNYVAYLTKNMNQPAREQD